MLAAGDYDKVLTATAPGVFSAMATAHRKLTDSLNAKTVTPVEVFAAVQAFAEKADQLHSIVDGFRAAQAQVAKASKSTQ